MDVSVRQPGALLSELLSDSDPPRSDCHLGKTTQLVPPADLVNNDCCQLHEIAMVEQQAPSIDEMVVVSEQDRKTASRSDGVCDLFPEKVIEQLRFPLRLDSQHLPQQQHLADQTNYTPANAMTGRYQTSEAQQPDGHAEGKPNPSTQPNSPTPNTSTAAPVAATCANSSSQAAALAAAAIVRVSAERSMNTPFSLTQRPSSAAATGEKMSERKSDNSTTTTAVAACEHSPPPDKEHLLQLEINYLSDAKLNMVSFSDLKYWCTVFYYELNTRVGDSFQAAGQTLTVDGFTEPCYRSDRFSLGSLSQVNRPLQVEKTRRYIGRGLKLHLINTAVYLECLSDAAIFAQSPSCNHFNSWHPATVVKVPPQCNLLLFDSRTFANQLIECISRGYESVFALTHMCAVRISFVKGWGAEYRRQTITSTPCWIEVHLNGPLKWLDRVLRQIGSPTIPCTSSS